MPPPLKAKQPRPLTVREFHERHGKHLQMQLLGKPVGFERAIPEPSTNRPGLALAGFDDYFAKYRVQVIGNSEFHYLERLSEDLSKERFRHFCGLQPPCLVIARDRSLPEELVAIANSEGLPVFKTSMVSMKFINIATIRLELDYAPSVAVHGCMVDVLGMGVMIMGKSGIGKSETTLCLLDRGAQFVADDMVVLKCPDGQKLVATQKAESRFHMEIRGIGIINVFSLYGGRCILAEKQLEFIVELVSAENINDLDRIGSDPEEYEILGVKIPIKRLAVTVGRDTARLVEVAVLHQRLRSSGYETATEFNNMLLQKTQKNQIL